MLAHAPRQFPSWLIFDVRQKMKRHVLLIRMFLVLWVVGCLVMLPALWSDPPWRDRFMRVGAGCVCLACLVNVSSALRYQRMWGSTGTITPSEFGGFVFFHVMTFLYLCMAGVCGWGAATFES